jgi:GDPmannose 4,6-dehydratase
MFACTGILSNHDSPLRPRRFVTRKIVHAVASLSLGRNVRLSLGNLHIERDWGWAPEYVEAIAAMLEQPFPADYIIATGSSHTLQEFMETAFDLVGKDWRTFVTIDESLMRPTDIMRNKVDPSKAASCLGWKAKNGMKQVVSMMLEAEMESLRQEKAG